MSIFKRNLLYVYGSSAINGLLGLAFVPIALRSLGATGYGLYSIFLTITSFVVLSELGVNKYFTRLLSIERDERKQKNNLQVLIGFYVSIYLFLIFFILPLLIYVIPNYIFFIEGKESLVRLIVALSILDYLFTIPTSILKTYTISNENFYKLSKFNLFTGLWRYVLLIMGCILFKSVLLLIIIYLLRRVIDFLYGLKTLGNLPIGSWKPVFKINLYKQILSNSLLLSVSQLFQTLALAIGSILVNQNFGVQKLGIYRSSFDIANKIWFISNGLGLVLFPKFSSMVSKGENKLMGKMGKYINLSWGAYSTIFIVAVFSFPLYNILFEIDKNIFLLLLLGTCYNAHSNLGFELLQAKGNFKSVALINFISFINMVLLFYSLHNTFGFISIGISWCISQVIHSFIIDSIILKSNSYKDIFTSMILKIITIMIVIYIFLEFVR
ncbi:hypothetical protein ABEV54_02575 [Peribacillus psychrosaccharolyticus]|uniref:lipopolysaccharide biosynthesis protein n=1 Tax=Peribacillus psychrosaccharolyticus TaxID=1407 RepID=UPI003D2CB2F9